MSDIRYMPAGSTFPLQCDVVDENTEEAINLTIYPVVYLWLVDTNTNQVIAEFFNGPLPLPAGHKAIDMTYAAGGSFYVKVEAASTMNCKPGAKVIWAYKAYKNVAGYLDNKDIDQASEEAFIIDPDFPKGLTNIAI